MGSKSDKGDAPPRHQLRHFLADVGLAAVEIQSLETGMPPIWIGMGRISDWDEIKISYPEHTFAGLYRSGQRWHIDLPPPGAIDLQTVRNQTLLPSLVGATAPGRPVIISTARPQSLLGNEALRQHRLFSFRGPDAAGAS